MRWPLTRVGVARDRPAVITHVDVLDVGGGHVAARRRFGAGERIEPRVLPGFPHAFADDVSKGR